MERGRPRQFDEQLALQAAMQVFWRDGYRGASVAALTSAMGINKPSLYATFSGKDQLYLRALDHYVATEAGAQVAALQQGLSLRDAVSAFLRVAVKRACDPDLPGGCYVVNAMSDCGTAGTPDAVAAATQLAFQKVSAAVKARLVEGKRDGELPANTDINSLANYFAVVMAGATLMARNGSTKAALNAVIARAIEAIPD
jgi:AcrR family transcriptional regulator